MKFNVFIIFIILILIIFFFVSFKEKSYKKQYFEDSKFYFKFKNYFKDPMKNILKFRNGKVLKLTINTINKKIREIEKDQKNGRKPYLKGKIKFVDNSIRNISLVSLDLKKKEIEKYIKRLRKENLNTLIN